jgi:CDP-glucose 4,6-dehydratase
MEFWPSALESVGLKPDFWSDRSVFLTGHTGFKGGWIALWLTQMGARVHGYSLTPPTIPNFFTVVNLENQLEQSTIGDIRNLSSLSDSLKVAKPSIVIHMAAQPLVRESYKTPVETFGANVMGTVNLLESVRQSDTVEAIVNITTDKCYENQEWIWPYRENDRLGGSDPYSSSKACAELATVAYRNSFFADSSVHIANVRAGNVIGGGDWAADRLIPDFIRALDGGETLRIRSPNAVRPWQHVLEPLSGYLALAEKLVKEGKEFANAWNFGPEESDTKPVSWIVDQLCSRVSGAKWEIESRSQPNEAGLLKLDSAKAKAHLGWSPRLSLDTALNKTIDWHLAWRRGQNMSAFSIQQIEDYLDA